MSIKILGVRIDGGNLERVSQFIEKIASSGKQARINTINPEFLVEAFHNPRFKEILNSGSLNTCDGFGIKLIARALYGYKLDRATGVEITEKLFQGTRKIFLLGGGNGIAEKVIEKFPEAKIAGCASGGKIILTDGLWKLENLENNESILEKIKSSEAEVLLVALRYGAQEAWIAENLPRLPKIRIAIGVGGTFDYLSGNIKRSPLWIRRIGLEWLFRLINQPERWLRIIKAIMIFPALAIKERILAGNIKNLI